ncbi:MAG: hypothetical protein MJE77_34175 [Proteobacteria bacterium]|nr:hypothetical protein [Pseudomonadota bacterium]
MADQPADYGGAAKNFDGGRGGRSLISTALVVEEVVEEIGAGSIGCCEQDDAGP